MTATVQPDIREAEVVDLGHLGTALRRSALLLLETLVVPAGLLLLGLHLGGATEGLVLVALWRCGLPVLRLLLRRRVPTAVWLSSGIFTVRTSVALATASVSVYLWQPIVLSALLGVFFIGSGLIGHPVTLRLTGDVVRLPPRLVDDARVRRIFGEVAVIWGVVHVLCAGMGALFMQLPTSSAVVAQAGLGLVCTVGSTAGAVGWGVRRLHALPDLTLRFARRRSAEGAGVSSTAPVPVSVPASITAPVTAPLAA